MCPFPPQAAGGRPQPHDRAPKDGQPPSRPAPRTRGGEGLVLRRGPFRPPRATGRERKRASAGPLPSTSRTTTDSGREWEHPAPRGKSSSQASLPSMSEMAIPFPRACEDLSSNDATPGSRQRIAAARGTPAAEFRRPETRNPASRRGLRRIAAGSCPLARAMASTPVRCGRSTSSGRPRIPAMAAVEIHRARRVIVRRVSPPDRGRHPAHAVRSSSSPSHAPMAGSPAPTAGTVDRGAVLRQSITVTSGAVLRRIARRICANSPYSAARAALARHTMPTVRKGCGPSSGRAVTSVSGRTSDRM